MAFLGAIAGGIGDLINGAANRAHEKQMMQKQQEMQARQLDADMKMHNDEMNVTRERDRRDGDRNDKLADASIQAGKDANALDNKIEDNDEKQAQFERDVQQTSINRKYAQQDKAIARVDKKLEQSDDNDFNIRSSFLKSAGAALMEATFKQFNILIVTDQENDEWETPVKDELASQLVDVQLTDGTMVNFEARLFA